MDLIKNDLKVNKTVFIDLKPHIWYILKNNISFVVKYLEIFTKRKF